MPLRRCPAAPLKCRSYLLLVMLLCFALISSSSGADPQAKKKVESAADHLKPGDKTYSSDKAPKDLRSMIQDGTITVVFNSDGSEIVKRQARVTLFVP